MPEEKLKVLFATSEVAPLIKTGGLADVSAALPAALMRLDADIRVLVPGYPQVMEALKTKGRAAMLPGLPGVVPAQLIASKLPSGVPLLVIESAIYQRSGGPYQDGSGSDWLDNDLRFGLLSYVGALLSTPDSPLQWKPDIVHCNDWQTGLTPVYLHYVPGARAQTVITIHNLAFQGIFPADTTARLGLPSQAFSVNGVEYYGKTSFLKGGLQFADRITTVSPSYAEEIQREPLGMGLQGLLSQRKDVLTGILNGIDTDAWDPESDPYIERYYNASRLAAKQDNKRALQLRMGLRDEPEVPLLGTVSRLTHQKGHDVLADIAAELVKLPAQLAVLGSGDAQLQRRFQELAQSHPGRIAVQIGFDEGLSHQIEAGADSFVMPSRFEPCGLNQMYSQRYGTPPVVHATGGLCDSVVDCTPETLKNHTATGFMFAPLNIDTVLEGCQRAVTAYHDKRIWRQLQKNGMSHDFSWEARAQQYLDLYRGLLE
ncbi:MAG TPA: glycogen synthase GlgA [Burkholderiales bacterium]|jgi:starch synthase|nr:glycogen synthase GlgA [Burkholderiales bacterium]